MNIPSNVEGVHEAKHIINRFYWMLLPSFPQYLFTLLGNVCLFNSMEYVANEVSEEYRSFYTRLLSTQVSIRVVYYIEFCHVHRSLLESTVQGVCLWDYILST